MKNAIIYAVVFLALQVGVTNGVCFIWQKAAGTPDLTAPMLVVSMAASAAVTMAVFLLARWCEVSRSYVRSRPWASLAWSVGRGNRERETSPMLHCTSSFDSRMRETVEARRDG